MLFLFIHFSIFVVATTLTQIGGIAWIAALLFKRRILAFGILYLTLSVATMGLAPYFGREPVSCFANEPLKVQSWMYCGLNRNYVTPELKAVLTQVSNDVEKEFPGTTTLLLDANFPFFNGFPLLPHLSHDDGTKADLAFYYQSDGRYLPNTTRSPIGYFAFEEGPTKCTANWPSLRWDFRSLQSWWPSYSVDIQRTSFLLQSLSTIENVEKIFIEPNLRELLTLSSPKIRFQGCRAARHDDHIHFQIVDR